METDNEAMAAEALDAFWNVIAQKFPEAKYGDLSPLTTFELTVAAERAIDEWTRSNVPNAHSETPKRKAPAHTDGPWKIISETHVYGSDGFEVADCTRAKTPRTNAGKARGSDTANAQLIRSAPELKTMVESARNAFRERLSCLNDESREGFGEQDDISDQIGNYTYLFKMCNTVLARSEGKF